MNVLVTGGAGYIGSHTVNELIKNGHTVIVVDNLSRGNPNLLLSDDNFINMDIGNQDGMSKIFREHQFDAVIHFAAYAYVGESMLKPEMYYSNNVSNTITLLNVMAKAKVQNIIFSSSCSTYGDVKGLISEDTIQKPINTYAMTKLMCEHIIQDISESTGLKYCILRYFNAAGADPSGRLGEIHDPEPHLIPSILNAAIDDTTVHIFGNDFETRDGTCERDYVHVTDIANAHVLGLNVPTNSIFNLGTGNGYTNLEVVKACEKIIGKTIKTKISNMRYGVSDSLVADNTRAIEILGWKPQHSSIDEIISTAWAWHNRRNK